MTERSAARINRPKGGLDRETRQLINQRKRTERRATRLGAKPKKESPSLLSRTFDVLSRGQYASAGAVQAALGKGGRSGIGGSLIDAFTGAKKGLEGKRKLSYSQVLEENPNLWGPLGNKLINTSGGRAVAGFAADVFLDPTTYLGTGLIKGVGKGVVEASGSKLASEAVQVARKSGISDRVAKQARKAYEEEAFSGGIKTAVMKKEAKKAGKEARRQTEERIMNEATKGALKETPNKIQLRFAGKKIAESTAAAKVLGAPGRAIGRTEIGQDLGKLFSTASQTGPFDQMRRMFMGRSVAEFEDYAGKAVVKVGNKDYSWQTLGDVITKSEMKAFIKAFEKGQVSELLPSKKGIDWENLADAVKNENKRFYSHDVGEGLIDPTKTPELDNYLYHHYQVPDGKASPFKQKRQASIASDSYKPAKERKIPFLEEAEQAGLKPSYDLREVMLKRAAKSYSTTARKNYITDAVGEMGMKLDKGVARTMRQQGHDLVNVKSELSKSLKKGDKDKLLNFLDGDEYMPREVAKYLGNVERVFHAPEEIEGLLKLYDNVLTRWKAAATIYNPGHHARNFSTDIFLNFVDGVKSPQPYLKAMDVLFKGTEGSVKIGKQKVDKLDVLRGFKETGAAPGWITTQVDEGRSVFRGRVSRALRTASGRREELGRLAHWIDAVEKAGKGKNLRNWDEFLEAGRTAAGQVRHWNIDYTDLTPFERTVMKRAIPFYTWMRHSTPLMLEAIATRPGKVATVPKGMNALQQLLGVDPDEALPVDLIPKWLKEIGGTQIGERGGNPLFMSPFFYPGTETVNMVEGGPKATLSSLASQTSPMIRAPFELAAGRTFFGQMPIESNLDYALNQIPAARVGRTFQANRNVPEKNDMTTRLINYLTGTGQYEVTPNRIRGELRRQMDPLEEYVRQARKRPGR